jgi:acyl-CoA synthetase (AMP-forming)/AMP-acid ligase II
MATGFERCWDALHTCSESVNFTSERFGSITAPGAEPWSGARLAEEIDARVVTLTAAGIERGSHVLLCHGGNAAFFADLLASWRVGAVVSCLHPGLAGAELDRIIQLVRPRALWCGLGATDAGPFGLQKIPADGPEDRIAPSSASTLDDPALLLFTSGTTAQPKGVVLTFRALLARVALNVAHIGSTALQRVLCPLPTHFGHGLIGNCLTALAAGADLSLMSLNSPRACAELGATVDQQGITFMSSVPAMWKMALRVAAPPRSGTLARVHVGSAPFSADLWRRVVEWSGTRCVVNMYGLTEAANWIAGASAAEFEPVDGLIGRAWGGSLAVLGNDGLPRTAGEGEILVQSPSLMSGYFGRPDLSWAAIRGGWLCTGDVGVIDADGVARLTGRLKYEINRAGIKIHPEDIELLLEQHSALRESCVFRVPDDIAGESVGAAISVQDPSSFDLGALKKWCGERLTREKLPEFWFVLNDIPKSDRGKISRDAVAATCLAGTNAKPRV